MKSSVSERYNQVYHHPNYSHNHLRSVVVPCNENDIGQTLYCLVIISKSVHAKAFLAFEKGGGNGRRDVKQLYLFLYRKPKSGLLLL
jgi:hypothetical protein